MAKLSWRKAICNTVFNFTVIFKLDQFYVSLNTSEFTSNNIPLENIWEIPLKFTKFSLFSSFGFQVIYSSVILFLTFDFHPLIKNLRFKHFVLNLLVLFGNMIIYATKKLKIKALLQINFEKLLSSIQKTFNEFLNW